MKNRTCLIWLLLAVVRVGDAADDGIEAREEFSAKIWKVFQARNYQELEKTADELRRAKARFPDGSWKLFSFYRGFDPDEYSDKTEQSWNDSFQRLSEWHKKFPESITQPVAEACATRSYAWKARGEGPGDEVSTEAWDEYQKRLTKSKEILQAAAKLPSRCPGWYGQMEFIALDQGWDDAQYDQLFHEAVTKEPTFYESYESRVRWFYYYGEPGEWERAASEAAAKYDPDEGMTAYTRSAWTASYFFGNLFAESKIDWPKMRQGFRDMERKYPNSNWNLNNFCRFACMAGDRNTAHELFERIGEAWSKRTWKRLGYFQNMKSWADPAAEPISVNPNRKLSRAGDAAAQAVAYSADGKWLAVGYEDGSVIIWNAVEGTATVSLPTLEREVEGLAISPNGDTLAIALGSTKRQPGGVLKILSLTSPYLELRRIDDWKGSVYSVCFSADGKLLAAVGGQPKKAGEARLIDLTANQSIPLPWRAHHHSLIAAAFSPKAQQLAVNCDRDLSVWDFGEGKLVYDKRDSLPLWPRTIAFAPNGRLIAAGCGEEDSDAPGTVALWDTQTWEKLPLDFRVPGNGIFAVAFSPDSKYLAGAGLDEAVYFWNTQTGARVATLLPMHGAVRSLAFAPDGKTVAVAADHGASIWKVPGQKPNQGER